MSEAKSLDGPPNGALLLARAGVGALPLAGRLPFVGGGGTDLPATELRLGDVGVDPAWLSRYARVCGFRVLDTLPATVPHVLAFPLHLQLMTSGDFPFPAIGLVHIANRITVHRPIHVRERLDLSVRATDLRPHAKGRQFDLVTEARVGDELVWEGVATNLRRGGGGGASDDVVQPFVRPAASSTWKLGGGLGRRYAAAAGDRNPIHLTDLTAKAFGFKRAIAHGMWTKARALAALEGTLPAAYAVDVRFKRPIFLPAKVHFGAAVDPSTETRFAVFATKNDDVHLEGRVTR